MNRLFIIKAIFVYFICISIYPGMYGVFAGLSISMSSRNLLREEAKNPHLYKQRTEALIKLQKEIKRKPLSEKEKLLYTNKEIKYLISGINWFFVASFSSGLAFIILGIIIGIFFKKWIFILFLILPTIYLVWWNPPLGYVKEGLINLTQAIIVIVIFQYGVHFIGIFLGSRIVQRHNKLPNQTVTASS